jgi:hypothetical protein
MTLLLGIAAVGILWWLLNNFAHTNPAAVAKAIRTVGGIVALGLAALLGLRGRIDMALLVGSAGVWLLGWSGFRLPGFGGSAPKTSGSVSRVRSAMIEMELDHDSGEMDGSVLAGTFLGRRLGTLNEADLRRLLAECRTGDPEGMRLIEAYLDRRFPQWRESRQEHARSGSEAGGPSGSGAMTEEEALQILGLGAGATPDEIRNAHRSLMKKLHPDQGGSTYLAARVNQAKELLMARRRSAS